MAAPGACDAACAAALYATRQARTIQGREMSRVVRTCGSSPTTQRRLERSWRSIRSSSWSRASDAALAAWPAEGDRIYLVDPLGNLVLAYPRDPDIKALAKDLTRLLKASRIG